MDNNSVPSLSFATSSFINDNKTSRSYRIYSPLSSFIIYRSNARYRAN